MSHSEYSVTFDHHSKTFSENRFSILKDLRTSKPVAYTEAFGGYWVVTSYDCAKQVLDNPDIFSSEKKADGTGGVTIPSVGPRLMPAETDAPIHTKLRRLAMPFYSPKALRDIAVIIDDIVVDLVDKIVEKKTFDIVDDISEVLPPLIGLRTIGFPEEKREEMVEAVKIALSTEAPGEEAANAFMSACGQMMEFVSKRRAEPADDLISAYIKSTDPVLSDEDIMWIGITLFVGGFKNPGAHISNALYHLGVDTDLRRRLIEDRSLIQKANTELLRFYSPGNSVARTVTQDTTLGGAALTAGDRLLVILCGANHDEDTFVNPENFDLDRDDANKHIAFGGGPHFCIGFKLTGMMFERLLNEIFDRIPNYKVFHEASVKVSDAGIQAGYITIPAVIE